MWQGMNPFIHIYLIVDLIVRDDLPTTLWMRINPRLELIHDRGYDTRHTNLLMIDEIAAALPIDGKQSEKKLSRFCFVQSKWKWRTSSAKDGALQPKYTYCCFHTMSLVGIGTIHYVPTRQFVERVVSYKKCGIDMSHFVVLRDLNCSNMLQNCPRDIEWTLILLLNGKGFNG